MEPFWLAFKKMIDMNKKWLFLSVASLLLIGLGLSLLGEAIIMKYENAEHWFWMGTAALVTVNTGFSLLGQAVIEKLK
ncbi:MAG: hypothetical protein RLZZ248_826 [Bacteroidota bacterium]|jgi:hypothetical protein